MKNFPDTTFGSGFDSLYLVKRESHTVDPLDFLELEKKEILEKLTAETSYSKEKVIDLFNTMTGIIEGLRPLRDSQQETDDFLKDTINGLRRSQKMPIIKHLLKAFENDETWRFAHKTLVYYANRCFRLEILHKIISDAALLTQLEAEKGHSLPALANYLNPLVFDETLLNAFYLAFDNYLWVHMDHAIFMNWFRMNPLGKPVFKHKMAAYFCYAIGKIVNRMIESRRPLNINRWIEPLINGNNFSKMKTRPRNRKILADIDNKLAMF
jgi:hypothetical protein